MAPRVSYAKHLQQEVNPIVDMLGLSDLEKRTLRARWLDQVMWLEDAANKNRIGYCCLRLIAIVGGVAVPALVSLDIGGQVATGTRWATFVLSLLVAVSLAVEEFFHLGERWRHYRRTAEILKSEGWAFLQRGGRYRRFETHQEAYPTFAAKVEAISQEEVDVYIEMVQEKGGTATA